MLKKLIENIFHRQELKNLREQNSNLLKDKYELQKSKIVLNYFERKMIMDCLVSDGYKEKVQNPATNRFIRDIYRKLKEKIKEAIKE